MYKSLYNFPTERQRVTYPWCFWDGAFTEEELKKICTYFETQELERSQVVLDVEQEVDESIRISNIKFCNYEPTNSDTLWIFQRMNMVIDAVNNQYYNFDLNGYDFFQYTEYDAHENGKYDYHMDTLMGNTIPKDMIETRKLSVTMCINEPGEEYEGGEFQINNSEEKKASTIETKKGRMILFPSFMIHRVAPVTKGKRKSIVVWVNGPKFR